MFKMKKKKVLLLHNSSRTTWKASCYNLTSNILLLMPMNTYPGTTCVTEAETVTHMRSHISEGALGAIWDLVSRSMTLRDIAYRGPGLNQRLFSYRATASTGSDC